MKRIALLCVAAALLGGCASPLDESWPEPRPLGREITTFRPAAAPPRHGEAAIAPAPQIDGELTLRRALALALLHNPDLAAFGYDVRAAEARILQAGVIPNPVAGVMVENFAGSGPFRDGDATMTTLRISQLIELAGKRQKRADLARRQADLAGWDYEAQRLSVFVETGDRFIELLANQRRVELAQRTLALTEQVYDVVADRVNAGVAPTAERDKANVRVSQERIALQRAERQLEAARQRLAAMWSSREARFDLAVGDLDEVAALPGVPALRPALDQHPRIARWDDEIAERRAAIALERAQAWPDVAIGPGIRYMDDTDENALVVEAMVPLPLFDRNQGNILAARYGLARARAQREAALNGIHAEFAASYHQTAAAAREATILREQTLPAARSAFEAARSAFREGVSDYLDVLDAERTLVETERQLIDALADYHAQSNQLAGLTAQPLPSGMSNPPTR